MLDVVQARPVFFLDEWDQTFTAKTAQIEQRRDAVLGIIDRSFQAMSPEKYEVRLLVPCCGGLINLRGMSPEQGVQLACCYHASLLVVGQASHAKAINTIFVLKVSPLMTCPCADDIMGNPAGASRRHRLMESLCNIVTTSTPAGLLYVLHRRGSLLSGWAWPPRFPGYMSLEDCRPFILLAVQC